MLVEADDVGARLGPFSHLGIACASREEVDRLCAEARNEGCLRREPVQSDGPAGYWAFLDDPDGHTVELTYGQEVDRAVAGIRLGVQAVVEASDYSTRTPVTLEAITGKQDVSPSKEDRRSNAGLESSSW